MIKTKKNRISKKIDILIIISTIILLISTPISIAKLDYNLTISTNQSQYYNTEQVSITGRLTQDGEGVQAGVCVDIKNPSGSSVLSVCFPSDSQGYYSVFYTLNSNSQIGVYNVIAKYEEGVIVIASASTTFEVVTSVIIPDAGETYYGIVNTPVSFSGSVSGGKRPYQWLWDFGDENNGNTQYPTNIYLNNDTYTISLLVIDSGGNNGEVTTNAIIENELISSSNGPYGGIIDTSINFIGSATGGFSPYTWNWDFGDGNYSNDQNPMYIYNESGTYTINLTVTDEKNFESYDETIATIILENNPPNTPIINGPINGKAGTEYEYTFSASDPDGNEVYFWILWFDGCPGVSWDGPYESGDIITKSYTYTEQDTYTLQVKAKDSYNTESDWATLEISMPNQYMNNWFLEFLENYPLLYSILISIIK